MSGSPQEKDVSVFILPGQDPNYRLESQLLKGDRLVFKNQNHPGFIVNFNIVEDGGGYRFPDDKDEALAAAPIQPGQDYCPRQGEKWPEFAPIDVLNDNKTLRVRNLNTDPADFAFTMFVTNSPGQGKNYLPLDPIGQNQNGTRFDSGATSTTSTTSFSSLALIVGALAIVALIAIFAFQR